MDVRKISLCLTNYNRKELLIKSFEDVLNDDRISEIIISDDCSNKDVYDFLVDYYKPYPKVKLHRNDVNIGMSLNKKKAINLATNDWCIIFDSDNIIKKDYIDRLFSIPEWDFTTIYHPDWAWVTFDFRQWSGMNIDRSVVNNYINEPMFECLLNVCNYFVHKGTYNSNYVFREGVRESDTIWYNYNHLKNNCRFYIVPDMKYIHTVHEGSGWLQNANYNMQTASEIKELIKQLH